MGKVATIVLEFEQKWRRTMTELGPDAKIPDLWKLSALLEIYRNLVQDQMLMRLGEIVDGYGVTKVKILGCVTNKVEQTKTGGVVPMDVHMLEMQQHGGYYVGELRGCYETGGDEMETEWRLQSRCIQRRSAMSVASMYICRGKTRKIYKMQGQEQRWRKTGMEGTGPDGRKRGWKESGGKGWIDGKASGKGGVKELETNTKGSVGDGCRPNIRRRSVE